MITSLQSVIRLPVIVKNLTKLCGLSDGIIVPGKQDWLAPLIISGYILVTPLWVWIAKKNKHTREVLYTGWTPVMAAMLISR